MRGYGISSNYHSGVADVLDRGRNWNDRGSRGSVRAVLDLWTTLGDGVSLRVIDRPCVLRSVGIV